MARHYINGIVKENKLLNLASAQRSTEINISHGQATTLKGDKIEVTMVPKLDECFVED